jgi:GTP 3',8-cyclase
MLMNNIVDTYGRSFKTLRVSLTNVCNLACSYCVDPTQKKSAPSVFDKKKHLSTAQYIESIKSLHRVLQIDTIRLTGGEPLLYTELPELIEGIKSIGIPNIKMTTNGILLADKIQALKDAGLTSINISLDAINSEVSRAMNQHHKLEKVLRSIDKTVETGMPLKLNCVVQKNKNDQHIMDVFEFAKEKNISIRFLELMQMGHLHHNFQEHFFSEKEIIDTIAQKYTLSPVPRKENATANYWTTNDGFKFGIISNISNPFCDDCNRLRLDSYGNIYGCLSDNTPIPIMDSLNDQPAIHQKLQQALTQKKTKFSGSELSMKHIGG